MGTLVDFNALIAAKRIAEEFKRRFEGDIAKAERAGYKLVYKLETEEQIGRGEIFLVRVRLIPKAHKRVRDLRRIGQAAIEGKAWYEDAPDVFDALKDAIEIAFDFASDNGVI